LLTVIEFEANKV